MCDCVLLSKLMPLRWRDAATVVVKKMGHTSAVLPTADGPQSGLTFAIWADADVTPMTLHVGVKRQPWCYIVARCVLCTE